MIFWRKVLLCYCCFSTWFTQLVVLAHGNEFDTSANSRQLESLTTNNAADGCSTCKLESMKTVHSCLLRCLSMLRAAQSEDLPSSESSSIDRCIPQKCFNIIGRCAYRNCGVQSIKSYADSLRSDGRSLEGDQRDDLHRILKQNADNSKKRRRRSSYLYRDLIIDDGTHAWLATGAERGQQKWRLENSPAEDVLSDGLDKRGYNDISDLCMEFNCGEKAPGSIEYLKCVQDNRCA